MIWYVLLYSVLGYGLEMGYALWKHGSAKGRRTMLLLPMCPVYGLGAAGILALSALVPQNGWLMMLCGALAATASEYGMSVFYEKICGVSFWDYRDYSFHLQGRVCLRFSIYWGLLTLPLVYVVHPYVEKLVERLLPVMLIPVLTLFVLDFLLTTFLLRKSRTKAVLDWRQFNHLGGTEWLD